MDGNPTLETAMGQDGPAFRAGGPWTATHAGAIEELIDVALGKAAQGGAVVIDLSRISRLDTFGAWLIERLNRALQAQGASPRLVGLSDDFKSLVAEVAHVSDPAPPASVPSNLTVALEAIGISVSQIGGTLKDIIGMLGAVVVSMGRVLIHPGQFRLTSLVHQLEQVGWRAVPIIVLITFLIGCIIAQQGIFHFRKFGADVFVVDMVGVLVLREIGVLIVSIMVAGRSGSAYTAELGSMKMREEIDALRTMGFNPIEVLILPRILALIVAVPILTFIGSMAALYGGGLVAWLYGDLQPEVFLSRLREAISLDHFKVGLIKAPFMALAIGVIACLEGLAVRGSAESLGQHTTSSVVKAIFFVIVLDGAFAIFFASIGM